ncbi:amidase [Marinobacter sp. 2_MG-2023]|uniref:amidase n=1 Tax=Marinobacter sp. 2_MG-2023 TaxID=3062679 RepID=UPI0026E2FF0C|nr:amidase [Marinobacter sp. 2_MG-2023]MDO6441146.1 amidase [Marinobacter sp. 2_MG-2023]
MNDNSMTINSYQAALAEGRASPLDWWHFCAAQIEKCEPEVRAWEALAVAAPELDADLADKPLFGVPVGIKDIIETVDFPTGWGTGGYLQTSSSLVDASLVTLLQKQGALVMGKTVSTELAFFTPGKTRNPHDPSRTPGGSSSGSAAAVAAGMVPLAFGTQTAGSMIRPASYCGVFGFKPTFDTLSAAGVKSFSPSLDTLGWFARNIEDICTTFSALTRAPNIAPWEDLVGVRVGIHSLPNALPADDDVVQALATAQARLQNAGAELVQLPLDERYEALVEHQKVVMAYEAAQTLASEYSLLSDRMSLKLVELIEEGKAIDYLQYREAMLAADSLRQALTAVFDTKADVILAASATGEAPEGLESTGDSIYCRAWTLLGVPCINLPFSTGKTGMPVGVQLIADRWQDQRLLEIVSTLISRGVVA